jgi:hypothetical protein
MNRTDKNVDIKLNVHYAFLEYHLSSSPNIERLESQIIKVFWSNKTKGPKQNSQSRLRPSMPEGGEP